MLKDFKQFLLRGNVVDLAVAVVVGAAFNSVVTALVKDFMTPLIAIIYGKSELSGSFTLHGSKFLYGDFLNAFVSFLITAATVFFLVVKPLNTLVERARRREQAADPTTRQCPECLSEVPLEAKRCKFCTAALKPTKTA